MRRRSRRSTPTRRWRRTGCGRATSISPYLELTAAAGRPRPGYPIPSISLKPDDLAILRRAAERVLALGSSPLGAPAASALRKLSFDLPVQAAGDAEVVLTHPVGAQAEKVFRTLREGVERRLAVRCRYYAIRRDEEAERDIEPYGLMLTWGHWYCIGRARDRDALRVFRLDRMRAAALLDGADARFEIPPGFSVQQYLDRAPWELSDGPATAVQVRIAFPTRAGPLRGTPGESSSRWNPMAARCSSSTCAPRRPSSGGCFPSAPRPRSSARGVRDATGHGARPGAGAVRLMAELAETQVQRLVALVAWMSQRDTGRPVRYRDAARPSACPRSCWRRTCRCSSASPTATSRGSAA
ncbi:MAG: WYL domain-containing protein [Gemmatimonadetes bacterium]|nr:WYL domain-containing protein [Gemmatimonadota bacterium]